MKISDIKPSVFCAASEAELSLRDVFAGIDETAFHNSAKVLDSFQKNRVSEACFAGTTGYGYDDLGRETLDRIYADVFGAEAALVRTGFVNGTHAITAALFALGVPGKTILSVNGTPYDTLCETIGIKDCSFGSLRYYGIGYKEINLLPDSSPDYEGITRKLIEDDDINAVIVQRSRGYADRRALTVEEIGRICDSVRSSGREVAVFVDNCYGEFTEKLEPTQVGADLMAGSLIKNPGGGLAPTGAYIAGKKELVDRAAKRLTSPGIGGECGSTLGNNRLLFQGFFVAPHVVAQALKSAAFCAAMLEKAGIETSPASCEKRSDIIQMIRFGSGDKMKSFCCGIQSGSPVDSYVSPEPWQMPGYDCPVIMAAGAFIQGSSIELSADGPFKPPYICYLQGGITYESAKLGIMMAVNELFS